MPKISKLSNSDVLLDPVEPKEYSKPLLERWLSWVQYDGNVRVWQRALNDNFYRLPDLVRFILGIYILVARLNNKLHRFIHCRGHGRQKWTSPTQ